MGGDEIMKGWRAPEMTMQEKSVSPLQKTVSEGCVGSLQCPTLIYPSLLLYPADPTANPGARRVRSEITFCQCELRLSL